MLTKEGTIRNYVSESIWAQTSNKKLTQSTPGKKRQGIKDFEDFGILMLENVRAGTIRYYY